MKITGEQIYQFAPYARTLGVKFTRLEPDGVQAELAATHELSTLGGGLHGGAIMSLCDLASAAGAALNIEEGAMSSTAESTTYFLCPVRTLAIATAVPLKVGRSLITMKTEVHDAREALCAYTTQMVHVNRNSS